MPLGTPDIGHYDLFAVFRNVATIVHISLDQNVIFSVMAATGSLFIYIILN